MCVVELRQHRQLPGRDPCAVEPFSDVAEGLDEPKRTRLLSPMPSDGPRQPLVQQGSIQAPDQRLQLAGHLGQLGTTDGVQPVISTEREQDITRHVNWASSDTELVLIGAGISTSAGFAVARTEDGEGEVDITATVVRGVLDLDPDGEPNPDRPLDDPDDSRDTVKLFVAIPDDQEEAAP